MGNSQGSKKADEPAKTIVSAMERSLFQIPIQQKEEEISYQSHSRCPQYLNDLPEAGYRWFLCRGQDKRTYQTLQSLSQREKPIRHRQCRIMVLIIIMVPQALLAGGQLYASIVVIRKTTGTGKISIIASQRSHQSTVVFRLQNVEKAILDRLLTRPHVLLVRNLEM